MSEVSDTGLGTRRVWRWTDPILDDVIFTLVSHHPHVPAYLYSRFYSRSESHRVAKEVGDLPSMWSTDNSPSERS